MNGRKKHVTMTAMPLDCSMKSRLTWLKDRIRCSNLREGGGELDNLKSRPMAPI